MTEIKQNPMKEIMLEKVVINIGVGEGGEKLEKASTVLKLLTNRTPTYTKAKVTNRDFGIRKGMNIGCKVTLRHKEAEEFLKKAFWVKNNKLASYSIDPEGNFSMGVSDYTLVPGMKYNPEIGVFGFDVCASLMRRGWRIKYRKRAKHPIGKKHRITVEEAKEFIKKQYNVEIV
ncbi:MAG: 50S ribosomal protein L5 [Thermoplasmata archaeon]